MRTDQCTRFHKDGTRCLHLTDHADGWCRQPDCDGYTRQRTDIAPESDGYFGGGHRRVAENDGVKVQLSVDTAADASITRAATDSFRFHHGGSAREAQAQLRSMLEDFLLASVPKMTAGGFTRLSRSGFHIVLGNDLKSVTGYSTLHRERTWAQIKAGVRSRFKGPPKPPRPPLARIETGPAVPLAELAQAIDPASIRITQRARREYEKLHSLDHDSAATEPAIRTALSNLPARIAESARDGDAGLIDAGTIRWLISIDVRCVISVCGPA